MWTTANRPKYNRDKLRYPSDLTGEEWAHIEALIPPAKHGGRKRKVDVREVVNGIMYVLSTGCQWRYVPKDNLWDRNIDDGLASLIARAIATRNMFLAGRDDSIDAMASRLGVRRDYVAVLVRLSYLSPEIVRAILVGHQPIELTPTRLVMLSRNLPHDWQEQRRLLGFAPADAAPFQAHARHVTGRKRALG